MQEGGIRTQRVPCCISVEGVSCSLIRKVLDSPWHVLTDLSPGAASCSGFELSELAITSRNSHMSALSMGRFQNAPGTGSAEEGKLRQ